MKDDGCAERCRQQPVWSQLHVAHPAQVETVTKTQDATETVTVSMDYNTWLEEVKQKGSCTYQGQAGWLAGWLAGWAGCCSHA
jgi:hypothetical protein